MDSEPAFDTEPGFDTEPLLPASPSPDPPRQLKRLKKHNPLNHDLDPNPPHPLSKEPEPEDENETDWDDLDPLFSQGVSQGGVNRVLDFDTSGAQDEFSPVGDDVEECIDWGSKAKRKKRGEGGGGKDKKPKVSKRKEKEERKAVLAQQADFQRVMRERKNVGFKPLPMVEKSISSVLEKIRLRKMEMLKRVTQKKERALGSDPEEEDECTVEISDDRVGNQVLPEEPVAESSAVDSSIIAKVILDSDSEEDTLDVLYSKPNKQVFPEEPVAEPSALDRSRKAEVLLDSDPEEDTVTIMESKLNKQVLLEEPVAKPSALDSSRIAELNQDKPGSSNLQSPSEKPLMEESEALFRTPVNDTQDLFSDSQTSDSHGDQLNKEPDSPVEDISPSIPSLNLKFDSAFPYDVSSDEEESDKENTDPMALAPHKDDYSAPGDPLKQFLDEEALEDDSDDDLLHSDDKEEEDDAYMEECCDYIASDFKEKSSDHERRNELHHTWLQQQDEAGTENLLQKLKYGVKKTEPLFLKDEDDCKTEDDEEGGSDREDTGDLVRTETARVTTKRLKQMIPQMFTDKDDGFVSSDDEETERRLSKQQLLQRVELEQQSKFLSPVEDGASREVFGRIRKLNSVPETKKKAKASSFFDALLTKGGSGNTTKSSFLRRASSHPAPSSHRHGPSTVRSFIFGRDDSRSSSSLIEDAPDLNQNEPQVKKSVSAKFTSSQAKWSTQHTQSGGTVSSTSLFEILKRSSLQTGHDARDSMVDNQAVSAAFKSVKKQIKVEGRS